MGDNRLLDWANKQVDWIRDALRRHSQSPNFQLSPEDKPAVVVRVQQAAGLKQTDNCEHEPLGEQHLGFGGDPKSRVVLASIGPVENVARLAEGQQLRFALNGITLIYGDNASGKSSYCRISKNVCRSQTVDVLLGDVFEAGVKPPPEALIRYRVDGDAEITEVTWKYGEPTPAPLKGISVFDSHNARFYIDKQNKVEFLPAEISLLECHAAHCREMGAAFEQERRELDRQIAVPLPGGFTPGGTIATALGKLTLKAADRPTPDELSALAKWTEADATELDDLEKSLAQDPATLAARDERSKSALETYLALLPSIEEGLSPNFASELQDKVVEAKSAAQAAAAAATEAFVAEPLPGVGKDPWRQMYEHAKAYIVSTGVAEEIQTEAGDPCALCQQPLSIEASDRLKRFKAFVAGETAAAKLKTAAALAAAQQALSQVSIPTQASAAQALAEYKSIDAARSALAEKLEAFLQGAKARQTALAEAIASEHFDQVPALPGSVIGDLKKDVAALEASVAARREQAGSDTKRAELIVRQNELKDRKALRDALPTVLARHADLEKRDKVAKCEVLVGTQQLSTFITNYRRELFTEALQTRMQTEISRLDLSHIPFAVSDRSKDGSSLFKIGLKAATPIDNDKVLSEGEQRALALACFLAEVGGDDAKNGLIIDDPVSSLDHLRLRRVAQRLVEEAAKGRQIVIFTHNLLFYNEVLQAAAASTPQVPVARRVVSKSSAKGFGLISEEAEPWTARKITTRIAELRDRRVQLDSQFKDFNTDEYRRAAKDFYTDLRETWERLVEELLLGEVVERYASEVKTQSLKLVEVTDEDYKTIFFAMKKVSERSGHDMAAGKQIPTPTPGDMKADLDEIDGYREQVRKRRKELETRRKALELPPQPELA
jgi:DNA repair exonuclease SbcCD ATPase subunit